MGVCQQVGVGQHHALGLAGGAGGIDDGGESRNLFGGLLRGGRWVFFGVVFGGLFVGQIQPVGQRHHPGVVNPGEVVARIFQHHHPRQIGQHWQLVRHLQPHSGVLDKKQSGAGVREDVGDVVRAVFGIQRRYHKAGGHARLVV